LQFPRTLHDDVERDATATLVSIGRQPRRRGAPDPADLLWRDHLQRIAETRPGLRLHLAEHESAPAAHDDVQLVPADPDVRSEDAIATQPVPADGSALGSVHPTEPIGGERRTCAGRPKISRQQMSRTLCAAVAFVAALFAAGGAQAKAPPDGVDVCGADGACVHLTMEQAETNWALWSPPDPYQSARPSPVAPFLVVHWHWPGQAQRPAYYIPTSGKTRQLDENGLLAWYDLADASSIRALTAKLVPFAVPHVTRVTVGGRAVQDPQSYLDVFNGGQDWFVPIYPRWLRIKFTADAPSPWTDGANDVRISRTGRSSGSTG
jgi:hypothetical protein